MKKIKIIIDTDIGSEMTDAAALTLAAISEEIELLGVTTVTHDSVFRAYVAKKILKLLEKNGIPVAAGFGSGGAHLWEKEVVFPEAYPPSYMLDSRPAWKLIVDLVNKNDNVVLVGIGPATNIAKALENDPSLPQKVSRLILMGGMIEPPIVDGKTIPRGFEYNFCNDPTSIEKIMKAGFALTLLPGDVTFRHDDPWSNAELTQLAATEHPVIKLLVELEGKSLLAMREGMQKARLPKEFAKPWVNDEILMAYVIKPELFKTRDVFIRWDLPDKYPRLKLSETGYPVRLVSDTNFLKTRQFIMSRLTNLKMKK